jgi:hypothetical protein
MLLAVGPSSRRSDIDGGPQEASGKLSGFLKPIIALFILFSTAEAVPAMPKTCDLDAFKQYPMREVLKARAIGFAAPEFHFPGPGENFSYWDPAPESARLAALARGLAGFEPELRPIIMLAAISEWTSGTDPMINFFVLSQGTYYDEVVRTLDTMGLKEHAALFREGRALFGPDYGSVQQRYDRWSDGHGEIRDVVLDAQLLALSSRYRALPDPIEFAAERIVASPSLTALFEPTRAAIDDEQRLSYLGFGLWKCLSHYDSPEEVSVRLAELPEPYRHIAVTFIFQAETLNGAVEQFFNNSSGTLAPDVVRAFSAMGLPKYAEELQAAIDSFPKPYPRELESRRRVMEAKGEAFRAALDVLTGSIDEGEVLLAMIRTARETGILPK